jgi:hypothetical protein
MNAPHESVAEGGSMMDVEAEPVARLIPDLPCRPIGSPK